MRVIDEVKRLTSQDFIESQLVRVVACSSEPSSLRLLSSASTAQMAATEATAPERTPPPPPRVARLRPLARCPLHGCRDASPDKAIFDA